MTVSTTTDLQSRIRAMGLLDPTDRPPTSQRRSASRLDSLQGKRGGFLDNRKGNADTVLDRVREVLEQQYEITTVVSKTKWVFSAPASPEILEELAACDFVVTAIGD